MPDVINIQTAKTQLSRLLDRERTGEVIALSKAGKRYAPLVPLNSAAVVLFLIGGVWGQFTTLTYRRD